MAVESHAVLFTYQSIYFDFSFGCTRSLCIMCWLSLVAASRGHSLLWCAVFTLQWLLLLLSTDSRCLSFSSCRSWTLELGLSPCGTRASLLLGIWDLPEPRIQSCPNALVGEFLTTGQPGKSETHAVLRKHRNIACSFCLVSHSGSVQFSRSVVSDSL